VPLSAGAVASGALRRALVVSCCGLTGVALGACESTQQESEKIGREGKQLAAGPAALSLGATNRDVRTSDVTLLSGGGRTAVAVRLTSTSTRAQAGLPVLVTVTGSGGKLLYSNQAGGLESSLAHLALLSARASAWWVDDQVLASQTATGVKVRVGTGARVPSAAPSSVAVRSVQLSEQGGIGVVNAIVVNGTAKEQAKMPVFAVALRGGRVVAAGRAVVAALAPRRGASASVQVFLVGSAVGAKLELGAVPTAG
jgi:hypothetical protein